MDIDTNGADVQENVTDDALQIELDAVRTELATALARSEEARAQQLYALADLENFKKRNERFLGERLGAERRTLIAKFLPVLDNLERALGYEQDSEGLRGGIEATKRAFEALLTGEGVTSFPVLGSPFDPRFAEAIGTRESDTDQDDLVVEEVQRGYKMGDDLLRPARVIVAKHVSPAAETGAED